MLKRGLFSTINAHLVRAFLDSLYEVFNIDLGFFLLSRHFFDGRGNSIYFQTVQVIDLIW